MAFAEMTGQSQKSHRLRRKKKVDRKEAKDLGKQQAKYTRQDDDDSLSSWSLQLST